MDVTAVENAVENAVAGTTHTWDSLVWDIFIVLMVLLFALLKAKKGLYNSFMPLVVIILAVAVGISASKFLTPVANHYFYPEIEKQVVEKFDNSVEVARQGAQTPLQSFQKQWNGLMKSLGLETKAVEEQVTEPGAVAKAREALKEKTEKSFNVFAAWVLFGICTAIAFLLLTLLKNIVGGVADWPVIKWLDWLGGFVIGLLGAMIILFVAVKLCCLFKVDFVTSKADTSIILKLFTDTF